MLTCAWCGEAFERPNTRGPAPLYCRKSHRQRAYEVRGYNQLLIELNTLRRKAKR
jgi:hypothetical protein